MMVVANIFLAQKFATFIKLTNNIIIIKNNKKFELLHYLFLKLIQIFKCKINL
jgi:hypothetical protein